MATWEILAATSNPGGLTASTTYYPGCPGNCVASVTPTTETWEQGVVRASYTLAKLAVNISIASVGGSPTITSRVNEAPGAQSVTPTSTGIIEDTTNTDSLVTGDAFNASFATGSTTAGTIKALGFTIDVATDVPLLATSGGQTVGASTEYDPVEGSLAATTTEANAQRTFRTSSTLSNLRTFASAASGTATIRVRINLGNGAGVNSFSASGATEDTTNTDSVVAGDEVNISLTRGTSVTVRKLSLISSSASKQMIASFPSGVAYSADRYVPSSGVQSIGTTTESQVQMKCRAAFTAKNLFIYASAVTGSGVVNVAFRIGSANTALIINTINATGVWEDTSNTVSVVAGDLYNTFIDYISGTSVTLTMGSIEIAPATAGAAARNLERLERHYPRGILRGIGRGME